MDGNEKPRGSHRMKRARKRSAPSPFVICQILCFSFPNYPRARLLDERWRCQNVFEASAVCFPVLVVAGYGMGDPPAPWQCALIRRDGCRVQISRLGKATSSQFIFVRFSGADGPYYMSADDGVTASQIELTGPHLFERDAQGKQITCIGTIFPEYGVSFGRGCQASTRCSGWFSSKS